MKKSVRGKLIIFSVVVAAVLFVGVLAYNHSQKGILFSPSGKVVNIIGLDSWITEGKKSCNILVRCATDLETNSLGILLPFSQKNSARFLGNYSEGSFFSYWYNATIDKTANGVYTASCVLNPAKKDSDLSNAIPYPGVKKISKEFGMVGCELKECSDDDGGLDYGKKGTTRGFSKGLKKSIWSGGSDKCLNENTLREYSCDGVYIKQTDYECESGCYDGKCKDYVPPAYVPIEQPFSIWESENSDEAELIFVGENLRSDLEVRIDGVANPDYIKRIEVSDDNRSAKIIIDTNDSIFRYDFPEYWYMIYVLTDSATGERGVPMIYDSLNNKDVIDYENYFAPEHIFEIEGMNSEIDAQKITGMLSSGAVGVVLDLVGSVSNKISCENGEDIVIRLPHWKTKDCNGVEYDDLKIEDQFEHLGWWGWGEQKGNPDDDKWYQICFVKKRTITDGERTCEVKFDNKNYVNSVDSVITIEKQVHPVLVRGLFKYVTDIPGFYLSSPLMVTSTRKEATWEKCDYGSVEATNSYGQKVPRIPDVPGDEPTGELLSVANEVEVHETSDRGGTIIYVKTNKDQTYKSLVHYRGVLPSQIDYIPGVGSMSNFLHRKISSLFDTSETLDGYDNELELEDKICQIKIYDEKRWDGLAGTVDHKRDEFSYKNCINNIPIWGRQDVYPTVTQRIVTDSYCAFNDEGRNWKSIQTFPTKMPASSLPAPYCYYEDGTPVNKEEKKADCDKFTL